MRKSLSLAAAAALLLCGGVVSAPRGAGAQAPQAPTDGDAYSERLRAFEEFVAAGMRRDRIPGMTVGFSLDDYTWVKGFGHADLENKVPAAAESAYRLASITKSFPGEAVVQLAERGKLDLDAEIQTYVPDYPKQKWPVTVRNLLTHTGAGQTGSGLGAEQVSPKEVVARYFIILSELSPEGRAALKQAGGEYERPLAYFRRAFESNPGGVTRVKTFTDIGGRWLSRPQLTDAGIEYVGAGVALHPKDAPLRVMLGDFLARKGWPDAAAESYREAYKIDPAVGKGQSAEEFVSGRLKAAAEVKKD